jgi:predicted ATPase/DNA-binding SARP family transcriptional activator
VEFRILGPLVVVRGGRPLELGGEQQRVLCALFVLNANRPLSADVLADALWGEPTPARAVKRLQVAIARLRRSLDRDDPGTGSTHLETVPGGYCLTVPADRIDAEVFSSRLREGRRELERRAPARAVELLSDALELWRGPPLPEVAYRPFAQAEIRRLDELRLTALEARIDAELQLGRHAALIGDLEALVFAHPGREGLAGSLMLALYRSGRQADALAAYQRTRGYLATELGLEPAPALQRLQSQILTQAPELEAPARAVEATAPGLGVAAGDGIRVRRAAHGALGDRTLPAPPNRTIGRERDLVAVGERLRTAPGRLVTLTGPGGVGKTRLALEAARAVEADFGDGARFVSLAAVQRPEDVPGAIIGALGIISFAGESPREAVERFLAAKHMLLVVDNFEHVLAAAPFIGALLGASPGLTVLATSREPLALHAEERYPVPPLPLPELGTPQDAETPAGVGAMRLFSERARSRDPAFALSDDNAAPVAEICRRVDGLPLAIELAAARCALMSPAEIAERLDVALGAPGAAARDAPARHHTLRATVDWSYQLLDDDEKACFARFAVFAGGATLEAAQVVTGADLDTLDQLVAKSLLVRRWQAHTSTRLFMLETLRAYAAERLEGADDRDVVREGHYRHCLAVAERHGTEQAVMGVASTKHLSRLDEEIHNFDAALRWAAGRPDAGPALAMVAALGWYWDLRERYATDAVDWLDRTLAMPGAENYPAERIRALLAKPFITLRWHGRVAEGPAILAEAQAIARPFGDPLLLAKVLMACSVWWSMAGRQDAADTAAEEALLWATAANDEWQIADAWRCKARAARNLPELRDRVDRAATLLEAVGNVVRLGQLFGDAAYSALVMGGDRDAREFADRAAPIVRDAGNPGIWMFRSVSGITGLAALVMGDTDAARNAFREELELCRQLIALPIASEALLGLAAVAVVNGDLSHAARLQGAAVAHGYGQQQDAVPARLDRVFLTPARRRHGADAWDTAVREGGQLSFEDAIAFALDQPRASAHTASST